MDHFFIAVLALAFTVIFFCFIMLMVALYDLFYDYLNDDQRFFIKTALFVFTIILLILEGLHLSYPDMLQIFHVV